MLTRPSGAASNSQRPDTARSVASGGASAGAGASSWSERMAPDARIEDHARAVTRLALRGAQDDRRVE